MRPIVPLTYEQNVKVWIRRVVLFPEASVDANERMRRQEGDFRTSHTRMREFGVCRRASSVGSGARVRHVCACAGESVAFYGGQHKEREQSDAQFKGAFDVG